MTQNQTVEEIIAKLPSEIQRVINFDYLGPKIEKIGKEHFLHIDQVGELYAATEMMLLGLTHPKNFVFSIKKRLEVSQGVAEMVAQDVNNQIFLEIRESLKKIAEQAPLLDEDITGTQGEKTSNLSGDSEHPVESDAHHATLKREDILRDIEDPDPVKSPKPATPIFASTVLAKNTQPQSTITKTAPAPTNLPVAQTDNDLPAIIPQADHSYPTPPKPVAPKRAPANIVTAKLGGVVVTATTVIPQKPSVSPANSYKTDPYRETF